MSTLKEVQSACLVLLNEFDRICKKNNIVYYMDSGTLLGAVRHQGFIPWDDDIDVSVFRKDYPVLLGALKEELKDGFLFVEPGSYEGLFYDWIPRILLVNSQRESENAEHNAYRQLDNKIGLDIFIIDEIPDSPFRTKWAQLKQTLVYGLALGHRYHLNFRRYHGLSKIFVFLLSLAGRLFSLSHLIELQQKWACQYNGKNCHRVKLYNYPVGEWELTFQKAWFEASPVILRFESLRLYAPENYHEVLTTLYGNYKQLPPLEKQIPEHGNLSETVIDMDFVRSCLEEMNK